MIASLGIALPEREVTSAELGARLGVTEGWIVDRTGIGARRVAGTNDSASTLGAQASHEALQGRTDVDLIICATITGDMRFPATACLIGAALGTRAPAYDINAGCSGFLFGLAEARAAIASGAAERVLVVGTEVMSRIVDQRDVKTAILFGDGAGAAVLEAGPSRVFGPFELLSEGSRPDLLRTDVLGLVQMEGREVYRHAVMAMSTSVESVLHRTGLGTTDIDLLIAHQANQRILDAIATRLHLHESQVFSNIARYGNTSAASIPIALYEAELAGRMKEGDRVLLTAFGAGFSWGAAYVEWPSTSHAQARRTQEAARV